MMDDAVQYITIPFQTHCVQPTEEQPLLSFNSGTCLSVNPSDDALYIVGTEEGVIRKCSKAYSTKFLASYPVCKHE